MINELPLSDRIDTKKLGRLFDNMSESYKLFWFKAIVDSVYQGKDVLRYDDLINEMIASGWYMVSEYKLNLGPSDTMEKMILLAYDRLGLKASEDKKKIIDTLNGIDDKEIVGMKKTLTLNVPYRLQAPYLENIKGKDWQKGPKAIAEMINGNDGLLYRFEDIDGLNSAIVINDPFMDYVRENYAIISGWIRFKMIEYLQKRNPSVPGIINKIDAPNERKLGLATRYWKQIINETEIRDIYSGTDLKDVAISIDHFIPWSYVAHDELWNLAPTTKSINSSKSNNLPSWDKYSAKMFKLQYVAMRASRINEKTEELFNHCLDEYVNDAGIRYNLYNIDQTETEFFNQIKEIMEPVYHAAKNLGFREWQVDDE